MPTDLDAILRGGGKSLVDLLQFAVISVQPEPLALLLARDYRGRPTAVGALAIFDLFCASGAPFRLRALELIPPRELSLQAAMGPIRLSLERSRQPLPPPVEGEEPPQPVSVPIPPRHLFAKIEDGLLADPAGPLARIAETYVPDAGPFGNLPGGKMTQGQRVFVDRVWLKQVRPALVAAGFTRVTSIGQP